MRKDNTHTHTHTPSGREVGEGGVQPLATPFDDVTHIRYLNHFENEDSQKASWA
ncbi:hypothetical protein E2C01_000538 [Portunus trituberculatus]|uniref:Uncharacterized protein n=1 Tax=Portunus trituberculatus TaxID=210409 RepID=A0A5B7CEL3_PORTR|nr:hypothetical protein [Portunus trituberculatus]